MSIWLALGLALAGPPAGFRGDGTGAFAGAPPLPGATPAWSTPLGAWSNAAPIAVGDQICTTAEPTQVVCVDAGTGAVRWRATSDYADTLDASGRAALTAQLAAADDAQTTLSTAQRRYSELRREVRRDPALMPQLDATQAEIARLQRIVDAASVFRTPPDKEIIGYASATPVSDGRTIFALFGNGVASAFTADGRRLWSVWLGPPPAEMRGYHMGTAASPLLHDGHLIVAHRHLLALDPATGAVRWRSVPYTDYATPSPVTVSGQTYLALADGHVVRASDGAVVLSGLGDMWFVGPTVAGATLYYVGGFDEARLQQAGQMPLRAWTLRADGAGLVADPLWAVARADAQPIYAAPILHVDAVLAVDRAGRLWSVDRATGRASITELPASRDLGPIYGALARLGDTLLVPGSAAFGMLSLSGPPTLVRLDRGVVSRAAPMAHAGHLVVRTLEGLTAWALP